MTLIVNNFSHPVILDDDRDPNVSWRHHRERGSLGGVDLAYPVGETVLANADGRFELSRSISGTGGRMGLLWLDDGSRIEYLHLSAFIAGAGDVRLGRPLAKSGRSASGSENGVAPHLHVHRVLANGTRVNVFDAFTSAIPAGSPVTAPAAGGKMQTGAEFDGIPGSVFWTMLDIIRDRDHSLGSRDEAIVKIVARDVNDDGLINYWTDAADNGVRGPYYDRLVSAHSNRWFGTRLTLNGVRGPGSIKAEIKIAAYWLNRWI